jgi:hypothetical protein
LLASLGLGTASVASAMPDLILMDLAAQSGRPGEPNNPNIGRVTSQSADDARANLVMGGVAVAMAATDLLLGARSIMALSRDARQLSAQGIQLSRPQWTNVLKAAQKNAAELDLYLATLKDLSPEAKALLRQKVIPHVSTQGIPDGPKPPNTGARPGQSGAKPEGAKPKPKPDERVPVPQQTPAPQTGGQPKKITGPAGTFLDPPRPRPLTDQEALTQSLSIWNRPKITVDDLQGSLPRPGGQPGHADKHRFPLTLQAEIINNPERIFAGFNDNGRQVTIFYRDGNVVITQNNDFRRVISAYGPSGVSRKPGGKVLPSKPVPTDQFENNPNYIEIR